MISGVTRGLSQWGASLERGPLIVTQAWYTGRNCYDAGKSELVAFAKVPCAEFEVRNERQKQNIIAKFFFTVMTLALQTPSRK